MDIRILENKEKIAEAFFKLLGKFSFEEITISEITGLAQVSRNTYYRHFRNKLSILEFLSDELIEDYFFEVEQLRKKDLEHVLALYFSFWLRHKSFVRILEKQRLQGLLLDRLRQKLPDFMKRSSLPWHEKNGGKRELIHQLMIGGAWNIFTYHLENKKAIHPELLSRELIREMKDTLEQDAQLLFGADL